ncbi:hypothetical protein CYY_003965 [Polysphondylium violaceum]|uniref:BZIP domain-containing protein n=1 Tax=Polysphondylium violaceum TaxID=133409 RepID=A0A8J4PTZ6_9MYCE|nr:hypothetical protein CYY_003965 [Polysphondylium violaceum]
MNASTDFLNVIGINEIDSFNKTLNEMLSVWGNTPMESNVNSNNHHNSTHHIHNNSNNQHNNNHNNNTQQQLDSNISSILQSVGSSNGSFLNLPIPSLRNSNKGILSQFRLNSSSNSFINTSGLKDLSTSSSNINMASSSIVNTIQSQQINDLFNNQNQSQNPHKQEDLIKTINEITIEQKSYQPIEIIPIKNILNSPTNSSSNNSPILNNNNNNSNNNNSNNNNIEFGVLNNNFILDQNKIQDLRFSTSVLDPILNLPYNYNNNPEIQLPQQSIKKEDNSNIHNNNFTTGPIRSSPFNTFESIQQQNPMPQQSSAFVLNNEELMSYTTSEMNDYAKKVNSIKDLTPFEKKELKRQKRLVKNRESAHLSRQRKRERLTDLEHRVEELTTNSVTISKNLVNLESENLVLKAEVEQLFEVIQDSPILTALFCKIAEMNKDCTVTA